MRIKLQQQKQMIKYHSSFNIKLSYLLLYFNKGDLKLLFFEVSNIEICKIIKNDNLLHITYFFRIYFGISTFLMNVYKREQIFNLSYYILMRNY